MPYSGSVIPRGLREITEGEYNAMVAAQQRASGEYIQASLNAEREMRESIKAKLVAGEPLTPEEANLIVG